MERDETETGAPSRREYVRYVGAVAGGGLLAGCMGGDGATPTAQPSDPTDSADTDATEASTPTESGGDAYTVTMAPMGEVEFERPPESVFTRLTHLAGMAFALGRGNDVNAMHAPAYYDALWNQFTPRLEGVSLDWTGLYSSWQTSKEQLYELDSDVHLADPASLYALGSWDVTDIEEVAENIGPWFGNTFSDSHSQPPEEWVDDYEYYGLWEMFEKVAQVFREEERYEALASIHADVRSRIDAELPSESDRPRTVMGGFSEVDAPYVYKTDAPGFLAAHVRPFKSRNAFGEDVSSTTQVDMEAMLEADPDVIFALGGMHPGTDMPAIRSGLEEHPVGREITAVKNGRVYAQGARYQGPILNLFQLEMTAKQLYPEAFGEWPTYETGPYPEIPAEERLFDRDEVAGIINGEF
ncbi:ABC transporter substrate-binding protein [Halorarum halobium]|uniref:ABC transporter substrate-binding protein n=1 Tax=Halorarum halobium TaxID=3075121 RepID=UPI0028AC9157|nr:ABC transporter substrate-binding protein [Halobaculum sp. XH14]